MTDDPDEPFEGHDDFEAEQLDPHEIEMIRQDLSDLAEFQATFAPEGYRGVSIWCHDCLEEHLYPWEMLRGNLKTLLETGETPVHEPAFAPEPDRYIPWDYARGYVDAMRDVGADQRHDISGCGRCGYELSGPLRLSNFCPRCGTPLLVQRLAETLISLGIEVDVVDDVLRRIGLPRPPDAGSTRGHQH